MEPDPAQLLEKVLRHAYADATALRPAAEAQKITTRRRDYLLSLFPPRLRQKNDVVGGPARLQQKVHANKLRGRLGWQAAPRFSTVRWIRLSTGNLSLKHLLRDLAHSLRDRVVHLGALIRPLRRFVLWHVGHE
eukprot:5563531-Pyramimonas_sp.AAC.1